MYIGQMNERGSAIAGDGDLKLDISFSRLALGPVIGIERRNYWVD
jgi:hypothetical protein